MIEINGKEYRNIQEQVAKNKDDIEEIKENIITYSSGNGIDINDGVISLNVKEGYGIILDTDLTDNSVVIMTDDEHIQDKLNAGNGININNATNVISVDTTTIATKSDIGYTHYITLYEDSVNRHIFMTFLLKNNVSTPYTDVNNLYRELVSKYGINGTFSGVGYLNENSNNYREHLYKFNVRGENDFIIDSEYFTSDYDTFDSGSETIYLENISVLDTIL